MLAAKAPLAQSRRTKNPDMSKPQLASKGRRRAAGLACKGGKQPPMAITKIGIHLLLYCRRWRAVLRRLLARLSLDSMVKEPKGRCGGEDNERNGPPRRKKEKL